MNTENFKEFLENPSRLYQLSYQELKSLVLQYPYSTNLHYLLLQKSAMEDHRELEQNRQKAATYSVNRTFLFKLLREITLTDKKETVLQLDEEFLELKDLSLLEIDTPPIAVADDLLQAPASALPLVNLHPLDIQVPEEEEEEEIDLPFDYFPIQESTQLEEVITPEEPDSLVKEVIASQPSPPPAASFYQPTDQVIGTTTAIAAIVRQFNISTPPGEQGNSSLSTTTPAIENNKSAPLKVQKQLLDKLEDLISKQSSSSGVSTQSPKPAPQPKRNFTSWVQQFQPDHVKQQLSELMEAKKRDELKLLKKQLKKAKKKQKKGKADQHIIKFAQKSLTNHQAIASETLAEILAEQGDIQKSLEMYERLKLYFPEKSTYFAAIIEKLKIE